MNTVKKIINALQENNSAFSWIKVISLLLLIIFVFQITPSKNAEAAAKKYGIIISDKNGKFTFYDWNDTSNNTGIEISNNGKIMVSLNKLVKEMPVLRYSYNSKSKKATVTNTYNSRKAVYTVNNLYCTYFSNSKSKGIPEKMADKTYLSGTKSSLMVSADSLKWVMGSTQGYQYYKASMMQTAGYDTLIYSGMFAYNPYAKITSIPKATGVTGISSTVKVTIPEGYSVPQVFELLVKKGVCASTDFLYDAMYQYDFSSNSLISKIEPNENRCYLLEGYLFPDTYEFYRLSKGTTVISRILNNTETKITADIRSKAESMGYTTNELLTIASLIEKETGNDSYLTDVSSVIHNRLQKPMPLQLDCTINYVERYVKPYISGDINRYNSFYNTYKCKALPAGPICNPGIKAIQAALNPSDTDNYYFYSDKAGNYYFTPTYEEIKAIQAEDKASGTETETTEN